VSVCPFFKSRAFSLNTFKNKSIDDFSSTEVKVIRQLVDFFSRKPMSLQNTCLHPAHLWSTERNSWVDPNSPVFASNFPICDFTAVLVIVELIQLPRKQITPNILAAMIGRNQLLNVAFTKWAVIILEYFGTVGFETELCKRILKPCRASKPVSRPGNLRHLKTCPAHSSYNCEFDKL